MSQNGLNWLNYHHLYYFWRVAREGSLSRAAEQLRLSHSTLSTQIRSLEEQLQGELFLRSGRALSLTALGRDILQYADEIFRVGSELSDLVQGKEVRPRAVLHIGVVRSVPRLLVQRLVEPVLRSAEAGPIAVQSGSLEELLDHMAAGALHLILSEQPPPSGLSLHVYSHTVGESGISIYGSAELLAEHQAGFPQSLHGAKMLLPGRGTALRERLDEWLTLHEITVRVVAELDDHETLRAFAAAGHGLLALPTRLAADLLSGLPLFSLGELTGLSGRFYLLAPERRMQRADAQKILAQARRQLFEPPSDR